VTVLKQRSAIVIGGSLAGLFAGNLLTRAGWRVDIYERAPAALASRGAGIARHPEMVELLNLCGADDSHSIGITVPGRTAYHRSGAVIGYYNYPQQMAAWSRVFGALKRAFPGDRYHFGRDFVAVEEAADGVAARFSDGTAARADLLVAADGFRSVVRAQVAPDIMPEYSGYVAWRGMVEERDLSSEFMADTFDNYAFVFPAGGQLIGYPVAAIDADGRRYNYLWYSHVDAGGALGDLLTDEGGRQHEYSIAPTLIRASQTEAFRAMARAKLPPRFAEAALKTRQYLLQPIYDVESSRIAFGRVALIGDAAFVARPHVGTGALKAGQDARALVECLRDHMPIADALARYQEVRVAPNRQTVALGRYLGAFIERGLDGPESDPALGLNVPKILRISARPTEDVLRVLGGDFRNPPVAD
jgi:2-polyprenyl-6-methoxyphenol hydroxylase-like FAD-dependent oxidoreductase